MTSCSILSSSAPNKGHLLSASASHAASWQSLVPSSGLGLHLEPNQYQVIIKWWLGLDTSGRSNAHFASCCSHHAVTCWHGGNVVVHHNLLCDVLADFYCWAHLSVAVEKGHALTRDHNHECPTDLHISVAGTEVDLQQWTSQWLLPLTPVILGESIGAAAVVADNQKLQSNCSKCDELGWTCTPLGVETHANWGRVA